MKRRRNESAQVSRQSPAARRSTPRSARRSDPAGGSPPPARWTFLTNHSHVLIVLARHPDLVLREVAALVGITERAVQRIIADLEAGGFLEREKIGRQNQYRIRADLPLRHPIEAHRSIGDLLKLVERPPQR